MKTKPKEGKISPERFVLEHLLFIFDEWGVEPNATKERIIEYIKKLLKKK